MLVPHFKETKLPKLDYKAGRQIFDKERTRENYDWILAVPQDSENPIDIRLRQMLLDPMKPPDVKTEFFDKQCAVFVQKGMQLIFYTGRIKDFYEGRLVRIKTRKGLDVIVPFGNVMEVSTREL